MIFWGALWFSIFALLVGLSDWLTDGLFSLLMYPMFGALAGLHLRSVTRAEMRHQAKTPHAQPPVVVTHESPSVTRTPPDPLTPVRNAANNPAQSSTASATNAI